MATSQAAEAALPYLAEFDEIGAGLPGASVPWLGGLRRETSSNDRGCGLSSLSFSVIVRPDVRLHVAKMGPVGTDL